jgi:predicted DNA-binding transcriptional regulator AlpA
MSDTPRAQLTAAEQILDERECAELLGIAFDGLQTLRRRGEGPPYTRIGKGIVRYLRTRVVEWLDANLIPGGACRREDESE